MSAKKIALTFGKVLTSILLVLSMVGVIGFFALFTNDFTSDFKSFYVEQDGQRILKSDSKTTFEYGEELRFDCKYTFGFVGKDKDEPKGFTVKVVPNITDETNFDFTVDGQVHSYVGEKDLTAAFDIQKYDGYFILTTPGDSAMQNVLNSLYSGKTVVIPDNVKMSNYFYTLVVSSYNGEITYNIDFNFYVGVESIVIDPDEVVF